MMGEEKPTEESDEMKAARAIGEEIAKFRKECVDEMHNVIVKECDELVESGYDLARGNGRGPWWAAGD